jgi:hypothetical protein
MIACEVAEDCGTVITADPCGTPVQADLCEVFNWNNLAYNASSTSALVDGTSLTTYGLLGGTTWVTFGLSSYTIVASGVMIEIDSLNSPFLVKAYPGAVDCTQ